MLDIKEKTDAASVKKPCAGERLLYPDLLRIIAALSVIVIHTVADPWGAVPLESARWQLLNVFDSFVRFSVPLFVMLSGMFFLDPAKPVSVKGLYKKNITHMAAAYFTWSFVYAAFENIFIVGGETSEIIAAIIRQGIRGHFTLWFLLMMIGLYMITPFLRIITKYASKRQLEYFLLLSFIFSSLVPVLLDIMPEGLLKLLIGYYSFNLYPKIVLGYTGCYVLGYYLKAYGMSKRCKNALYISGVLSLLFTIGITAFLSLRRATPVQLFYDNLAPNTLITAAAVFVFVKEHTAWLEKRPTAVKAVSYVSSCTLGIYLVHDLLNEIIRHLGFDILNYPLWLAVPLYSAAVFALSLAIIGVIKKIPFVNKYIV